MYMPRSPIRRKAKYEAAGATRIFGVILNNLSIIAQESIFNTPDRNVPLGHADRSVEAEAVIPGSHQCFNLPEQGVLPLAYGTVCLTREPTPVP